MMRRQEALQGIVFCATGKTGLGHLRRITNIAQAVRTNTTDVALRLCSNAPPAGMSHAELSLFDDIVVAPRSQMAQSIRGPGIDVVVVDTAILPGLAAIEARLCLVLRETVPEKLPAFRLEDGRGWDLICLPNPGSEWCPDTDVLSASRVEAVGWIYRRPASNDRHRGRPDAAPKILVAIGGGGNDLTIASFRREIEPVLIRLRGETCVKFDLVQAIGPRAPSTQRLAQVDRVIDPGPGLNEEFASADLVISTVGYNSVLELACTDVPVLLVPIDRTYDDQVARAERWSDRLGLLHRPSQAHRSVSWMASVLAERRKRNPVELGLTGAQQCAGLISELLG